MELNIEQNAKDLIGFINAKRAAVAAVVFSSLVGPGFLALYRFEPKSVETWDTAKILLFCLSVGVPAVLAISMGFFIGGVDDLEKESSRQVLVIGSCAVASILLYLAHFVAWIEKATRLHTYFLLLAGFLFLFMITGLALGIKAHFLKKPPAQNAPEPPQPTI